MDFLRDSGQTELSAEAAEDTVALPEEFAQEPTKESDEERQARMEGAVRSAMGEAAPSFPELHKALASVLNLPDKAKEMLRLSDDDKDRYAEAVLRGERYKETIKVLGGRVSFVFRTLTNYEEALALSTKERWLQRRIAEKSELLSITAEEVGARIRLARWSMSLETVSVNTSRVSSFGRWTAFEALGPAKREQDLEKLEERIQKFFLEDCGSPFFHAASTAYRIFEGRLLLLQQECADANF